MSNVKSPDSGLSSAAFEKARVHLWKRGQTSTIVGQVRPTQGRRLGTDLIPVKSPRPGLPAQRVLKTRPAGQLGTKPKRRSDAIRRCRFLHSIARSRS